MHSHIGQEQPNEWMSEQTTDGRTRTSSDTSMSSTNIEWSIKKWQQLNDDFKHTSNVLIIEL